MIYVYIIVYSLLMIYTSLKGIKMHVDDLRMSFSNRKRDENVQFRYLYYYITILQRVHVIQGSI